MPVRTTLLTRYSPYCTACGVPTTLTDRVGPEPSPGRTSLRMTSFTWARCSMA
eukprot:CAMPEP_0206022076 /NCGR_PEP_ID=MMETSP1464-20131121/34031_1 /ASSEMBLY_ACC=CAM_ASM_001124 /TAXON_ID=119497 /ORGANISM="Exanthemachrysis gayraliae, Strain RCC1523" /LENGTH=52 /DNA_ID=CAMNT_0053396033 /DNA_START=26 /DNA_END=180 /DNA_ORIENTATION=+